MPSSERAAARSDDSTDGKSHRIVIFLHAFAAGGAEAVLLKVANDLHRKGIDVMVVAASATGPNRRNLDDAIEVIDLGARRMALALPGLVRTLKRLKPTACLSALTHSNLALIIASKLAKSSARIVVSERLSLNVGADAAPRLKSRVKRNLIARLYPKADRVIVVSKAIETEMEQMFPSVAGKVVALANPVDVERLRALASDETAYSAGAKDEPVVAFVGRLSRQKNLPLLLQAFWDLRNRRPAKLVLAGDGPLKQELTDLVRELGLAESVDFAGYLDNPYRLVSEADVLALSSDFEGLPNVLIEALALGTEIVSTDCPTGPAEILADGKYGHLVPCGDRAAFAEALERAISAPLMIDREKALAPYEKENALTAYRATLL